MYVTNLIKLLLCAFFIFIYIMEEILVNADATPTNTDGRGQVGVKLASQKYFKYFKMD